MNESTRMPLWVIAPVIAVFIAGFATLWIAVANAPTELDDPYQQRGDVSNARFEADISAANLGLSGTLKFDSESCLLDLYSTPTTAAITVYARHATRRELDWSVQLKAVGDGRWRGQCGSYRAGRYYLRVESVPQQWRLLGRWDGGPQVSLAPRSLQTESQ